MAPRKTRIWSDNSKNSDLLDKVGIVFEGQVNSAYWPRTHVHTFSVIKDIERLRYNEFTKSNKLANEALFNRRLQADNIARRAHNLLRGQANEQSWTSLENSIMDVFEQAIICKLCKGELSVIEYEAQPSDMDAVQKLATKRQRRKMCACYLNEDFAAAESGNNVNIQTIYFAARLSTAVTHVAEDEHDNVKLENTNIPMAPDRTIGLAMSPRGRVELKSGQQTLTHFPLKGVNNLSHPFLLIEAKREIAPSGFSAIEAQTAFPIRRLVLDQESLYAEARKDFAPLVWFFAYQGAEWRLYAGTRDQSKVRVYDLWHGTIESVDGALQLLQIVDYLRSWARDVYRPQIRKSLTAVPTEFREQTPLTDVTAGNSQSVLSDPILMSPATSELDIVMEDHRSIDFFATETASFTDPIFDHRLFEYGRARPNRELHSFSRAEIRHSNTIRFIFRILKCPSCGHLAHNIVSTPEHMMAANLYQIPSMSAASVVLEHGRLSEIQQFWSGEKPTTATFAPDGGLSGCLVVRFYFRSFFDKADWQIVRELTCALCLLEEHHWSNPARDGMDLSVPKFGTSLIEALSAVKNITGKHSVSCAVLNTQLKLSFAAVLDESPHQFRWEEDSSADMERAKAISELEAHSRHFIEYHISTGIAALECHMSEEYGSQDVVEVPEGMGSGGGLIAVKPASWPATCPKFCLFVFSDVEASDKRGLGELFDKIVNKSPFELLHARDPVFDQGTLRLDKNDKLIFRQWRQAYRC